ncbi:hypothetical protein SAMN02800687_1234 [Curtobacterium sp. UNCCL20]|uniref:hypothetical protein n=1 Tax=Curtobacterium sp. UNCCL20 TaxID=1502773 RepID=UPI00088CBF0A|nr:hypothetical protein [Curtobacterium sp. UNCCL20]SDQ28785.1 hypothetical protein SAMN02800687_1234 [Curtobacterium sp. UNCCL20]
MSDTDRPDERPAPAPNAVSSSDEVTIRRAPKFGVFIVGGAVLGFVATLIVVSLTMNIDRGDQQETSSFGSLVGYFSLWGVTIGAFIGAVVAVVLDRVFSRRSARLTAERVEVELPPETVDGEIEDHGDAPERGDQTR